MALQAAMQRRARQMRDRRLQRIEAVVERQQGMPAEGDDDRLFLELTAPSTAALSARSAGRSTDVRASPLATVFGLIP